MQLVYLLTLKPVLQTTQTPFYAFSNTMGYLANYPPSPFGEGRGEAFFPHSVLLKYNGVSR